MLQYLPDLLLNDVNDLLIDTNILFIVLHTDILYFIDFISF